MGETLDHEPRVGVTQLLIGWGNGDRSALDEMLPLLYGELRRLAAFYLKRERSNHTLQPTALVHEAYIRLIDQKRVNWKNRAQFFGLAAEMMRRILVNHARDRVVAKRGGHATRVALSAADSLFEKPDVDMIALDDALLQLAQLDPRKSRIVELKFFGGLTTQEIAEIENISSRTVERIWTFTRAWLYRAIKEGR